METPAYELEPSLVSDEGLWFLLRQNCVKLRDEHVWYLLLSRLWQDPCQDVICKLLCCSKAMAALVRYACKGSVSISVTPYMCAFGKIAGNQVCDVDSFEQWMCRNSSIVRAVELHPELLSTDCKAIQLDRKRGILFKESWKFDIPALAASLAAAPHLKKLVLGSILKRSSLQQLVLALPRASQLVECSINHAKNIGSLQESLQSLPTSLETLHVEEHDIRWHQWAPRTIQLKPRNARLQDPDTDLLTLLDLRSTQCAEPNLTGSCSRSRGQHP